MHQIVSHGECVLRGEVEGHIHCFFSASSIVEAPHGSFSLSPVWGCIPSVLFFHSVSLQLLWSRNEKTYSESAGWRFATGLGLICRFLSRCFGEVCVWCSFIESDGKKGDLMKNTLGKKLSERANQRSVFSSKKSGNNVKLYIVSFPHIYCQWYQCLF